MTKNDVDDGIACVVKLKRKGFFKYKTVDKVAVFFTSKTKIVHTGESIQIMERTSDTRSGSEIFSYSPDSYTIVASMKALSSDTFTVTHI